MLLYTCVAILGLLATVTLAAAPAAVLPSVAELPDWLVAHGYVAHKAAS